MTLLFPQYSVGFLVCPTLLQSNERAQSLWRPALQSGYCITLFRDEVLMIHKYIEVFFDSIKGYVVSGIFFFFWWGGIISNLSDIM